MGWRWSVPQTRSCLVPLTAFLLIVKAPVFIHRILPSLAAFRRHDVLIVLGHC